jgi:3-hydroxyisobutyrate dehydrogenase-like beta-hydroxyacid dehydrogenase
MFNVAFIGLGRMGGPMAGHLARAGHRVFVYNRGRARAESWAAVYGGKVCSTPAEAADGADFVFICVGNDSDLFEVTCGPQGALSSMRHGAVLVDHTTTSAQIVDQVGQRSSAIGISFLDAPVSGGEAGAVKGALSIMVGGDVDAFNKVRPVLASYGSRVVHMGASGSGQRTKMVNQICIAGLVQALAEAIAFAENAQVDIAKALTVIAAGAAQSWQLDNRGMSMHESRFDFGFAVDLMRKDLHLCRDEAACNGSQLPITNAVDAFYAELQRRGGGRLDTSSLVTLLAADKPAKFQGV